MISGRLVGGNAGGVVHPGSVFTITKSTVGIQHAEFAEPAGQADCQTSEAIHLRQA